jgi:hypothetical protein
MQKSTLDMFREESEDPNATKIGGPNVTSVDTMSGLIKRLLSLQTGALVLLRSKYTELPASWCKPKHSVYLEILQIILTGTK